MRWWDDEMMRWCYLRAPPWPAPTLRGCRGRGQEEGGPQSGPRPRPLTRPHHPQAGGWSSSGTRTSWKIGWETGKHLIIPTDTWYDRHSPHRHTWTFHQYHSRKPWNEMKYFVVCRTRLNNIVKNMIHEPLKSALSLISGRGNNNKCTNFIPRYFLSSACIQLN